MKLIVQIPCFNEEQTLPQTYADIPKQIDGFDEVEVLIIDDGSSDRTIEVAREIGVNHIVINKKNLGLAKSFRRGIEECLRQGADAIVNTDGDNQYAGWDIPKLVKPVLDGQADIVIGDRQTDKIAHFSRGKKFMQWFGSGVVRKLAGIWVPDTVSGFRAISREAAIRLNVLSSFSYTIEMVIQAGKREMNILSVPVETNEKTRESRLFKSIPSFISRQLTTIVRMYSMYSPLKVFFIIGSVLTVAGILPIFRFLFFYFTSGGAGHLQSLVLGGVLVMMGFVTYLIGLLADLISFNRQLSELTLERVRRLELDQLKAGKDQV
ncbi:MAG: glycosyltransferase family 2 protein [Chromatiales bacterium]|jgi:glycosyltransferase involved in cell wall biosynthesis